MGKVRRSEGGFWTSIRDFSFLVCLLLPGRPPSSNSHLAFRYAALVYLCCAHKLPPFRSRPSNLHLFSGRKVWTTETISLRLQFSLQVFDCHFDSRKKTDGTFDRSRQDQEYLLASRLLLQDRPNPNTSNEISLAHAKQTRNSDSRESFENNADNQRVRQTMTKKGNRTPKGLLRKKGEIAKWVGGRAGGPTRPPPQSPTPNPSWPSNTMTYVKYILWGNKYMTRCDTVLKIAPS